MVSDETTAMRGAPAGGATESAVQSVQRAARILACFSRERPELGVTDLSRELGLHKSTVSRLLMALRDEGLVTQVPGTGKNRLGVKLLNMAGIVLASLDLPTTAAREMRALADETGETVSLVLLQDGLCFDLYVVPGHQPIHVVRRAGQVVPLMASAGGRVLAAFRREGPSRVAEPGCRDDVSVNGADPIASQRILDAVCADGYAVVEGEWAPDLVELAVPVWDHQSQVKAALTVSAPAYRISGATTDDLLRALLRSAQVVSSNLGHEI